MQLFWQVDVCISSASACIHFGSYCLWSFPIKIAASIDEQIELCNVVQNIMNKLHKHFD